MPRRLFTCTLYLGTVITMEDLIEMVNVCCSSASSRSLSCAQIRNGGVRISGFKGIDVMAVNSVLAANDMRCTFLFESDTEIQLDVYPHMPTEADGGKEGHDEIKPKITYTEFAVKCGTTDVIDKGTVCNAVRRRVVNISVSKVSDEVFIGLTHQYNIAGIRLIGRQVHVYTTIDTSSQYSLSQMMQSPRDTIECLLNRKRLRNRRHQCRSKAGKSRLISR